MGGTQVKDSPLPELDQGHLGLGSYPRLLEGAAVAVAAWDQSSLDSGSWIMSQELLLEAAPPYAAFHNRRMPEPHEQAASKLIDERWLAVLQWKLRDQDSYIEARKRLGQSRGKGDSLRLQNEELKLANPKKGGKKKEARRMAKAALPKGARLEFPED